MSRDGQHFLKSERVAEIEAVYGEGKNVLEIGAGKGMLTKALCRVANKVVAVEKDFRLYCMLKYGLFFSNLKLLHGDFFKMSREELELDKVDIIISNIPYSLSTKTIEFIIKNKKRALLCIQKEFAERLMAREGEREYSMISVFSNLFLSITKIMDIGKSMFYPEPKVDSTIVLIKPKDAKYDEEVLRIVRLIMEHKKKRLKNAILDSLESLGKEKEELRKVCEKLEMKEERVFKLSPESLVDVGKVLAGLQQAPYRE
ncbi:MAG: 16S rRNA (adenine(1518)-N(6)/adenine(1519)-N(6))-dimethyltransferase RsmA [Candidatus Micrarchaeaceae archaeon]